MRPLSVDPTAGRRARAIRAHPELAQPIVDPTDSRYGALLPDPRARSDVAQRIIDPTDREYGKPAD